jgi:hypothetical protein
VASSPYVIEYVGTFWFGASPERIWDGLERTENFPLWWTWLRDFDIEGRPLAPGSVLHGVVCPPLPYRMGLTVKVDECARPRLLRAQVHGDLEGEAGLMLEQEGAGTRATAAWTIEMMQPPMRLAARVARPLLQWGHDRVVEATVASFRGQIEPADITPPGTGNAYDSLRAEDVICEEIPKVQGHLRAPRRGSGRVGRRGRRVQ